MSEPHPGSALMRGLVPWLTLAVVTTACEQSPAEMVRSLSDAPSAALAFTPDGTVLAAAGGRTLRLYEVASGRVLTEARNTSEMSEGFQYLAFSPDGRQLISVHDSGGLIQERTQFVHLWDFSRRGTLRKTRTLLEGKARPPFDPQVVPHAEFSCDGKTVAVGNPDGIVYLFEAATGKERLRFPGSGLAHFAADNPTLIAIGRDGVFRAFDSRTGRPAQRGSAVTPSAFQFVAGAAFAADGSRVALWDWNCYTACVSIRDAESGAVVARRLFPTGIKSAAFSPDGKTLVVASQRLYFLDATTGAVRGWREGAGPIAFSRDGRSVAWGEGKAVVIRKTSEALARMGQPTPPLAPSDPPNAPLTAEFVARKDTYTLNTAGKSAAEYSGLILREFSGGFLGRSNSPDLQSRVDLALRIRNNGNRAFTFVRNLDPHFYVDGPGALNIREAHQVVAIPQPYVTVAPGEAYTVPITKLGTSFWVLPGEYTIHAECSFFVDARLEGADKKRLSFSGDSTYLTLRPAPLKVRVVKSE